MTPTIISELHEASRIYALTKNQWPIFAPQVEVELEEQR